MAQPDIRCQHCGYVFRNLFEVGEGSALVLRGNTFICPNCRGASDGGSDGVYVAANGVLEKIASVVPSEAELDALLRVLRSPAAQKGPEALVAAAEAEIPRLVPMLELGGLPPKQWAIFVVALIAAIVQLKSFVGKADLTTALGTIGAAITAALASKKPKDTAREDAYKGTLAALEDDRKRRNEKKRARRSQRKR